MASLNEKLLSLLECPVCYNLMRPPFYLCENGHGVCNQCLPEMHQTCPTCRGTILERCCLQLEAIFNELEVPCKNKEDGCTFVGNAKQMKTHKCLMETEKCPRGADESELEKFRPAAACRLM